MIREQSGALHVPRTDVQLVLELRALASQNNRTGADLLTSSNSAATNESAPLGTVVQLDPNPNANWAKNEAAFGRAAMSRRANLATGPLTLIANTSLSYCFVIR